MADSEDVVVNLLIREQGLVEKINGLGSLQDKLLGVIGLIEALSTQENITWQEAVAGVQRYNQELTKARAIGGPNAILSEVSPAALKKVPGVLGAQDMANAEAAKMAAAAREKQVQEELYLAKLDADRAFREEQAMIRKQKSIRDQGAIDAYAQMGDEQKIGKLQLSAEMEDQAMQKRIRDEGAILAYEQMAADQKLGKTQLIAEAEDAAMQKKIRDEGQVAALAQMADDQRIGRIQLLAEAEDAARQKAIRDEGQRQAFAQMSADQQLGRIQSQAEAEDMARVKREQADQQRLGKMQLEAQLMDDQLAKQAALSGRATTAAGPDMSGASGVDKLAQMQVAMKQLVASGIPANEAFTLLNKTWMGTGENATILRAALAAVNAEIKATTVSEEQLTQASAKAAKQAEMEAIAHRTTVAVLAQENELRKISATTSAYQQAKQLAELLPQIATQGGVPLNNVMREVEQRFQLLPGAMKQAQREMYNMTRTLGDMAQEAFNLQSILNTAFGVGMAMMIFQLQMMVTKFFTDMMQQIKDLQGAISKLSAVEVAMSNEGIDVTGADLLAIVTELEKKWVNISNTDMLAATGDMGLRLASAGVSPEQLKQLMEITLASQVKNPGKTLGEIQSQLTGSVLTGDRQGIQGLGLQMSEQKVKEKAVELGLINDITQAMTEQQKVAARIAYLYEQHLITESSVLAMQNNLANSGDKLTASWKNLLEAAAPVVNVWNSILYLLAYAVQGMALFVKLLSGTAEPANNFQKGMVAVFNIVSVIGNVIFSVLLPALKGVQTSAEKILWLYEKISGTKISAQPTAGNLAAQDTPTGTPSDTAATGGLTSSAATSAEDNSKKIRSALNSLGEAMISLGQKAAQMEADFQAKMRKMAEEASLAMSRFMQDWLNDRTKIISDGNRAAAEAEDKFKRDQLDKEAKFQEQLRQLKEKFLLSMEDAIENRDARAAMRLMREYAVNKENMIREHALSTEQDQATHAADMAKKQQDTAAKLAELDRERALKLQRMQQDAAMAAAEARRQHAAEMKRLEQERQDKIRQAAAALAEQLNLTGDGAKAIADIFNQYFGSGGVISNITDFMYGNVTAHIEAMMKEMVAFTKVYNALPANAKNAISAGTGTGSTNLGASATGSSVPRNWIPTFGLPKPPSTGNSSNSSNSLSVVVTLSPDLEGRIVDKSVGAVNASINNIQNGMG